MLYFYHPESDSLWCQNEPLLFNDGLVEEISKLEYEQLIQRNMKMDLASIPPFDATNIPPNQGGEAHPLGKFLAQVTNTSVAPTKSGTGGQFIIEYTTPAGKINDRFQLWNDNELTSKIAREQLSAVCWSTGVLNLGNWQTQGAALRGARLTIEVGQQIDKNTKQPTQYVEVKRVYDINGNEPGKAPTQQPQTVIQGAANQPQSNWGANQGQPQANGGWGAGQQTPQQPVQQSNPNQGGWGAGAQNNQPAPSPGPTNNPAQGWQQGPSGGPGERAPWK